ncbi:MAG: cell division protein FtsA [Actinobacteria bacterium]|nr:cell division protein FtsA [Actinomycetota bacterium]
MVGEEGLLVGIDIGTTKICAITGRVNKNGEVEVSSLGLAPSYGLKKGVVVDIDKAALSVKEAVKNAEQMSGIPIKSAFVGLAGAHILSLNNRAKINIRRRSRIITPSEVDRVIEKACKLNIPSTHQIIHAIPRGFIIDGQDGVSEPVGFAGKELEVDLHIITGAVTSIQNIITCVNKTGVLVEDIVLEPIASSKSVLANEEKEAGVILVDIGGGTTDLAIFVDGRIWHTFVLPVGGNHVTQDIGVGLKIPFLQAEQIKKEYGYALTDKVDSFDLLEIKEATRGFKPLLKKRLAEIIESRMEEIFSLVKDEVTKTSRSQIFSSGVVLTGGASKLNGITDLASKVFEIQSRCGFPQNVSGFPYKFDDPVYATGIGLIRYASENKENLSEDIIKDNALEIVDKIKSWFSKNFGS